MQVYDYYDEKNKRGIKKKFVFGGAILLLIILGLIGNGIYLEYLQYAEIGEKLTQVYTTNLTYQVLMFIVGFVIVFFVAAIQNRFIKKNLNTYFTQNELAQRKFPNFIIAAVGAFFGGLAFKELMYGKILSFMNASQFNSTDPIFGKDIGYYIFQRPFYMSLYNFLSGLWIMIIIFTIVYYLVGMALASNTVSIENLKVKSIIRHNLLNVAIYFLIRAASYWLVKQGILYGEVVNTKGAGYIDVNVWLPYYTVIPYLIVFLVAIAVFFIWKDSLKKAAYAIAVYPAVWILVSIIALGMQSLVVGPNETTYQYKYLSNNIEKTREAYSLDKIETLQFPDAQELTPDILARNKETKDNIRIVDIKSTLDTDKQLQSNTNFYTFNDGDIINYTINGKEVPIFITAREIDRNKLADQTYINLTYKYTHGYGIVMNPINKLTSEGQAGYIMSDLKVKSVDPNLKVSRPEIYYGELTKDHVIVNSGLDEIDYDGSGTTKYKGQGGIQLNLLNKLLFSIKYGDFNMFISSYSNNATLLLNRDVVRRAQKAVPFLSVDQDPYIILTDDGRLKWVLDAYTTSSDYPYSQSIENTDLNYIRNSVKIVIDAYDGKADYYIIDSKDPIINTYDKIYPGVFTHDPLPNDIKEHLRYPELLFKIQTELLKKYHLKPEDVSTFYSNQDSWNIAKYSTEITTQNLTEIEPYYNMIKLPGVGAKEELILMRPFTPSGDQKHNMVSWLAVRNSGENYGQMMLFTFPKNTNIFGPNQVEVKINQIDKISSDMTLWGQSGSDVYKGNLLVIPIENSILYVEPIYLRSAGNSSIPQVKEIVVGYQSGDEFKYGIGATLDIALNNMFAGKTQTSVGQNGQTTGNDTGTTGIDKATIDQILKKYDDLKKQLDEMGSLIEKLK